MVDLSWQSAVRQSEAVHAEQVQRGELAARNDEVEEIKNEKLP